MVEKDDTFIFNFGDKNFFKGVDQYIYLENSALWSHSNIKDYTTH